MSDNVAELTRNTLLKVRQKLLDLSKRNRLLNFKETARSIRIIDELPDQVFKTLVTDIKGMTLIPNEDPEERIKEKIGGGVSYTQPTLPIHEKPHEGRETGVKNSTIPPEEFVIKSILNSKRAFEEGIHLIYSGLNEAFRKNYGEDPTKTLQKLESEGKIKIKKYKTGLFLFIAKKVSNSNDQAQSQSSASNQLEVSPTESCDIPDKHYDLCLQTPYNSTILERRCGRLLKDARTAIEETGSNFLYLNIGFLEWYEDDESEISYKAPLILIPVTLEKGKVDRKNNCYNYKLTYMEDDITTNLSMALKLSKDYDIVAPELDEQIAPSKYLDEISQLIRHKRRWRVTNEIVIGMFSFAKILMYKDLDPDKWINGINIVDHEKIREVLRTKETFSDGDNVIYDTEHEIDGNNDAERIPLIWNADSSQHSVLIDALSGKDLVVEGPPGTGKSQTITNLIAATLYDDKSVLFVAEKKAALEVVRRRLDRAGLGDFCLELHSTKTHKGKIREDIRQRIDRHFKQPEELKFVRNDLIRERDALREYVNLVNQVVGPNGETIYQVMWKAERWRTELPKNQKTFFSIRNTLSLTRNALQDKVNIIKEFIHLFKETPLATIKTFTGFTPATIYPGDEQALKVVLTALVKSSENVINVLRKAVDHHHFPCDCTKAEVVGISQVEKASLADVPNDFDQTIAARLIDDDAIKAAYNLEEDVKEYNSILAAVDNRLSGYRSLSLNDIIALKSKTSFLESLGYGDFSFDYLDTLIANEEKAVELLSELNIIADTVRGVLIEKITNIKHFETLISLFDIIASAPADIDINHHFAYTPSFAPQVLTKAKDESLEIKNKIDGLSTFFIVARMPRFNELRKMAADLKYYSESFFSFLSLSLRRMRRTISEFVADNVSVKHPEMVSKLYEMADLLEKAENLSNNQEYSRTLGLLFKGIDTQWSCIENHVSWSQQLKETVGLQSFAENIVGNINNCRDLSFKLTPKTKSIIGEINSICQKLCLNIDVQISIDDLIKRHRERAEHLRSALDALSPFVANKATVIREVTVAFNNCIEAERSRNEIDENDNYKEFFGAFFRGVHTNIDLLRKIVDWISGLTVKSHIPEKVVKWVLQDKAAERLSILANCIAEIEKYLTVYSNVLSEIGKLGNIDEETFFSQPIESLRLSSIAEKFSSCLKQLDNLFLWNDYCKAKERASLLSLSKIIAAIENGSITPEAGVATLNYSVYNSISRELIQKYSVLASFTSAGYNNIRSRFIDLDRKVMQTIREEVAYKVSRRSVPHGVGAGPVSGYTEGALIKQELNKRRRHIPTRQLIKRSTAALKALKPCFMMSPLSVAQYLEPGKINFDLIVMDEASQIKPEDALGAIARGSNLVIVGDRNQLPPTTFFDRINENYDDEETTAIEDTDSILDICRTTYRSRRLRWHYRSEHESLIDYSNREFYDSNLIVFPSPTRSDDRLGIRSHYIKGAAYSKGKNLAEAQSIVTAIIQHFESSPEISLGVATLNKEQRDLIEDLLDKKRKQDSWLDNILKETEEKEEPFFIKNLENVQGDERDVIFISFTYGPDASTGKVYQRFGPILGEVGWRRLNVIFTRAKKRVEVFTSMLPTDIILTESSARGARVLRDYLDYALNGKSRDFGEITKKEPDSDFEIAVARILHSYGYKTAFQVGVAGFYIDIGVVHPERESDFILGIECDGATYHTGKSVRDRDRLRQEILEQKGWRIHRIWSTDWFKNRAKEIEKLIKTISQIEEVDKIKIRIEPERLSQQKSQPDEIIVPVVKSDDDLREELLHYREVNIEPTYPDQTKGILRDEMIDAFVLNKPITKEDFLNSIPARLRQNIDSKQGQFLNDIFQIIEEYT